MESMGDLNRKVNIQRSLNNPEHSPANSLRWTPDQKEAHDKKVRTCLENTRGHIERTRRNINGVLGGKWK